MADKEQDPFAFIMNDCRYSSSQEELLTQVPFAGEGKIFSGDDDSPEMKDSRESRGKWDGTTNRSTAVGSNSERATNLGFEGERKLEGNCEDKEEEVVVVSAKKKVRFGEESEKKEKKRELPRSLFESRWNEFGILGPEPDIIAAKNMVAEIMAQNRRNQQQIGNVGTSCSSSGVRKVIVLNKGHGKSKGVREDEQAIANADNVGGGSTSVKRASVEGKGDGKCKGGGDEQSIADKVNVESSRKPSEDGKCKGIAAGEDETNKCILDALKLLVTHNQTTHDDAPKVDLFHTAKRCGMVFPTSRFLSDVQADD